MIIKLEDAVILRIVVVTYSVAAIRSQQEPNQQVKKLRYVPVII